MTSDKPSSPGDQWLVHEGGPRSRTYNRALAKNECFVGRHSVLRHLDWCFAHRWGSQIHRCEILCSPRGSRSWCEDWVLLSVGRNFRWKCHIDSCTRALEWWWENVRWTERNINYWDQKLFLVGIRIFFIIRTKVEEEILIPGMMPETFVWVATLRQEIGQRWARPHWGRSWDDHNGLETCARMQASPFQWVPEKDNQYSNTTAVIVVWLKLFYN